MTPSRKMLKILCLAAGERKPWINPISWCWLSGNNLLRCRKALYVRSRELKKITIRLRLSSESTTSMVKSSAAKSLPAPHISQSIDVMFGLSFPRLTKNKSSRENQSFVIMS